MSALRALAVIVILGIAALAAASEMPERGLPDLARLQQMAARFAPAEIGADLSKLPSTERQALVKMVAAARLLDAIYLRQVWSGNQALLLTLLEDRTPLGEARLHNFMQNRGPWSRLDGDAAFLPGVPPKPGEGGFYPAGASKAELEAWFKGLPEGDPAKGFFTTIRRTPTGGFAAVPYSLEYQGELAQAAGLLEEAAKLTREPTLAAFLSKRAQAFLSNQYRDSDVAWMELDAAIEPTIGPYEVYEDGWFNFKAAFEAFITLRDDAETAKLARLGAELQELEDHLPVDPALRNPKLGALAPIRVVNVVFAAADGNRGVQTTAFNLPNDETVVREKGSKRVMLRNIQQAKFEHALLPISKVALPASLQPDVSFDAFFTHTVMHELMHGLGPHNISVAGRASTVRQELKESYGALEEAKADISGLWALQYLVDKGILDQTLERTMYTTYLASAFRSIRFGVGDAHGRGVAVQLNTLLDAGAFKVAADGTFSVDQTRIRKAVADLTAQILTIQAHGDAAQARDLLTRMGGVRPAAQRVLDRLTGVAVDIEPRFVNLPELLRR